MGNIHGMPFARAPLPTPLLGVAKVKSILEEGRGIMFEVEAMGGQKDDHVFIHFASDAAPVGLEHLRGCRVGYLYSVKLTTGCRSDSGTAPLIITAILSTARRRDWRRLGHKKSGRISPTLIILAAAAIIIVSLLMMALPLFLGQ